MKEYNRLLIALGILLAGAALVPYVGFPAEQFTWERYADAYEPPVTVEITDFAFAPQIVHIPVGTTVQWANQDAADHTVTSDPPGMFDSGTLQTGETFAYQFNTVGTYNYICSIHPSMTGTVIVSTGVYDVFLPLVYH